MTASGRRCLGLLLAGVLAAAGCGIPLDESPRAISASGSKPAPEQQTASPGNSPVYLYFIKNDHLAGATRDVPDRGPSSVLAALLAGPTAAETSNGLISQIPAGTSVSSVASDGQTLHIAISKELADVVGASRQEAIAQTVFTVTELDGRRASRIRVSRAEVTGSPDPEAAMGESPA